MNRTATYSILGRVNNGLYSHSVLLVKSCYFQLFRSALLSWIFQIVYKSMKVSFKNMNERSHLFWKIVGKIVLQFGTDNWKWFRHEFSNAIEAYNKSSLPPPYLPWQNMPTFPLFRLKFKCIHYPHSFSAYECFCVIWMFVYLTEWTPSC